MSKVLPVVFAPAILAVVGVEAIGKGAARVAKKVHEKWKSIPPEERAYLLPFGATGEFQKTERAALEYKPVDGFGFGDSVPDFGRPAELPAIAHNPVGKLPKTDLEPVHAALLQVENEARAEGFEMKVRALPPGQNILIADLFPQPKQAPEPVPLRRR